MLRVEPVVLEGRVVRLEPLEERHAADLSRHAVPEIFRYMAIAMPTGQSVEDLVAYIGLIRDMPNVQGFAIVLRESGEAVGVTTYLDIRPPHRGLEIGMTWVSREHQGTVVNPECKLLLLSHAFEDLGCVRVQLKTDGRNLQSQAAIEKLGAKKEGVLRKHMIMPDGFVRDTVMYSILAEEWPAARGRLLDRIS